eukprot:gnl/Chilomastix_caulleri/2594.p2 GENE.gnl/Chilomastix_caulleri/2594~~gnl/Chilomastix_caulleri/2594.p2  ORF type:complete len:54 (-),score=9.73 gnl/Chilomastix_caulleri/2594:229-390(-)
MYINKIILFLILEVKLFILGYNIGCDVDSYIACGNVDNYLDIKDVMIVGSINI